MAKDTMWLRFPQVAGRGNCRAKAEAHGGQFYSTGRRSAELEVHSVWERVRGRAVERHYTFEAELHGS